MDKIIRKSVLIGSVVLLAGAASASDIYKHVDDDGTVSYGDRPTGAATEERVNIVSRATNADQVQASVDRTLELEEQHEVRQQARAEKQAVQAEQNREAADRASKCADYQQQLTRYSESRRLYREDASGERVFLDEDERVQETERVSELITEFCN